MSLTGAPSGDLSCALNCALNCALTYHHAPMPFRKKALDALLAHSDAIQSQADDIRLFRGVFGHPNFELLTLATWQGEPQDISLPGLETMDSETLTPTARPKDLTPLPEGGIVVLRWFQIDEENLDEFVTLSEEAWVSLEAAFNCKIMGLYRAEMAPADKIRMLLYTWYESHAVWEASRDTSPEAGASKAWENFLRRQLLTDFTEATVVAEVPLVAPQSDL